MPRRSIYFRDELDARITAAADTARRARSDWVAMACERLLGEPAATPVEQPRKPAGLDLEADPAATPSKSTLNTGRQERLNKAIERARRHS